MEMNTLPDSFFEQNKIQDQEMIDFKFLAKGKSCNEVRDILTKKILDVEKNGMKFVEFEFFQGKKYSSTGWGKRPMCVRRKPFIFVSRYYYSRVRGKTQLKSDFDDPGVLLRPTILSNLVEAPFSYKPKGKEEFVFDEMSNNLRKYGYRGFCRNKNEKCEWLNYKAYVGKKGYFLSLKPIHKYKGEDFYQVIIETGEVMFLKVSSGKDKYQGVSNIISYENYLGRKENSKYDPIVKGSKITI